MLRTAGAPSTTAARFAIALSGLLRDYHKASSIETFTVSRTERHPTELAGLMGARLVTASETEEGAAGRRHASRS
jgi:phage/plasmid-associated DNA primase